MLVLALLELGIGSSFTFIVCFKDTIFCGGIQVNVCML